jgi:DNA-binding PadR family transcriptional regulator
MDRTSIYRGEIVRMPMNSKIKRIYVPMTESGFYILFCLQQPQHGYGISQQVKQMTGGELIISAGTMYGTLSKMEKDGLIVFEKEEEKRKLYRITELGKEILNLEINRIERLYKNSKGEGINE